MKKRKTNIIFMGTSEFGIPTLRQIENNFNLLAIVTNYDKPSGRGLKIRPSAVKNYAIKKNIDLLQPVNLKDQNFVEQIKIMNPDLIIVVAFRMLPKVIWSIPNFGTINLHASMLPNYRGAAPINWVLINGEKYTGVTTFFINDKIDTGDILMQKQIKINVNDNAKDLHNSLSKIGSLVIYKTIIGVTNNNIKPIKQKINNTYKTAYKLNKDNIKLNWKMRPVEIYNKIRGLSPYPGARTTIINNKNKTKKNIIIYDCDYKLIDHELDTGYITVSKDEFKIYCMNGYILIKDIKMEGKKRMKIKSFLNGFNINNSLMTE